MRAPRILISPGQRLINLKGWPILGFIIGFAAVFWLFPAGIPAPYAEYLSLAGLAGIDSALGGIRAGSEHRFRSDVFVSGLILNIVISLGLVYFGSLIGVNDLYLAAVVVLGGRIFTNLSVIRRHWLDKQPAGVAQ